ncbi:MAG: DUF4160 domain-containing protein [Calditrichaeota bacterium]|jgi:hypothetical protein|nr:DUF4160 domain-containing protein [Calditrichota bacterium]MBT7616786.1 DUF4160 domain-containing protein [Calditrichota bacterium]MBT7788116.1 DUF4160 domain-containing protein [Calditrichota bacterium]
MPIISRFFGIIIFIFWRDHNPPHFHARYGDDEVIVEIESGVVTGRMPNRALALIQEWRILHIKELMDNWARAEKKEKLERIQPLE